MKIPKGMNPGQIVQQSFDQAMQQAKVMEAQLEKQRFPLSDPLLDITFSGTGKVTSLAIAGFTADENKEAHKLLNKLIQQVHSNREDYALRLTKQNTKRKN